MLSCGVKFCGGCNPRYDRRASYEEIRRHFEGRLSFSFVEEGGNYDILLYMAGCASRCTDLSAYTISKGAAVNWDEGQTVETIKEMEKRL